MEEIAPEIQILDSKIVKAHTTQLARIDHFSWEVIKFMVIILLTVTERKKSSKQLNRNPVYRTSQHNNTQLHLVVVELSTFTTSPG